ncbi:MAG: universal stress protein [Clostridia bacterium]|nr:universal stress protein [Clostridia bacterium]
MDRIGKAAESMTEADIQPIFLRLKKILVATDGSPPAVKATNYAIGLAKAFKAEVLAVYVNGNQNQGRHHTGSRGQTSFCGVHPSEAGLVVAKALGEKNGVKVYTTILTGSVAKQILNVAEAEEIDILVIGESGCSGSSKISLGSIAETLLRISTTPILVIRRDR